jgi:hypothetical protein
MAMMSDRPSFVQLMKRFGLDRGALPRPVLTATTEPADDVSYGRHVEQRHYTVISPTSARHSPRRNGTPGTVMAQRLTRQYLKAAPSRAFTPLKKAVGKRKRFTT